MGRKLQGLSLLAALGMLPAGVPLPLLAALNLLMGLGVSVGFPILLGSTLVDCPRQAPRLSALLMLSFTLGAQGAGLGMGALAEQFGLRTTYLLLAAGALPLCAAVAWLNRALHPPTGE